MNSTPARLEFIGQACRGAKRTVDFAFAAALARHIAVYAEPAVRGSFPDAFDEKSGDIQYANQQRLVVIVYALNF
jgi:hypothetical protein